jgi:WhiB family transcriptional regulator, redox-sensing transcriptional regulator
MNNDDTGSQMVVRLLAKTMPGTAEAAIGAWTARARCAETDPEIFFPPKGAPASKARAICGKCVVRDDCLAYALDAGEEHGIWGGLDPDERRGLRRRHKRGRCTGKDSAA